MNICSVGIQINLLSGKQITVNVIIKTEEKQPTGFSATNTGDTVLFCCGHSSITIKITITVTDEIVQKRHSKFVQVRRPGLLASGMVCPRYLFQWLVALHQQTL